MRSSNTDLELLNKLKRYLMLAKKSAQEGQFDQALDYYTDANKLCPYDFYSDHRKIIIKIKFGLALCEMKLNQVEQANKHIEELLRFGNSAEKASRFSQKKHQDEITYVYYLVGKIYAAAGKDDLANTHFTKALGSLGFSHKLPFDHSFVPSLLVHKIDFERTKLLIKTGNDTEGKKAGINGYAKLQTMCKLFDSTSLLRADREGYKKLFTKLETFLELTPSSNTQKISGARAILLPAQQNTPSQSAPQLDVELQQDQKNCHIS